jgi:hypothetical protein
MRTLLVLSLAFACDSSSTPATAKATSAKTETKDAKPDAKPEVKADPKPDPTPPAKPGLTWTIETEPKTLKLAELDELRVRVTVTNGGDAPAAPIREARSYTVDGKPSHSLNLAFTNGGKSKVWSELPPGESADDSRMGVAFTDAAGDHTIVMADASGAELARTVVHIDP